MLLAGILNFKFRIVFLEYFFGDLKNESYFLKTRLRVNLRPRVDCFKIKFRPCQDHVCQVHVWAIFLTCEKIIQLCKYQAGKI